MSPTRPTRSALAVATGQRVRSLREARGLSVSSLARSAGLGKGTLSELETGRRNPTIETLYAITTALEVPLSAALPPPDTAPTRGAPIRGDAIEAVLVERWADVGATTELYRATIRAGRRQRSKAHAPGVTEHWIVYSGVVEMGPHGQLMRAGPNETGSFAADVPHEYEVVGDEDVAATLLVRYPDQVASGRA